MRLTRRHLLIGGGASAALALAGTALAQRPQALKNATPIPVAVQPMAFLSSDPARRRFGSLVFRSGLHLTSPVSSFGGFSGLWRSANGRELLALADNAQVLQARVESSGGRLTGLAETVLSPLLLDGGKPLRQSRFYDTESLAISGGVAFIGVERSHAVLRFSRERSGALVRGVLLTDTPPLKDIPGNKSLEAIGIAPPRSPLAGAVVAIAERARTAENAPTRGFILTGPQRGAFDVVRSNDYDISDLAFLDDGSLLVLERRVGLLLGGFACRIRQVAATAIRPGARVDGDVLFESDASLAIDNMEGLCVHREDGEIILTLISDDNFSLLQRTLLLEFALVR